MVHLLVVVSFPPQWTARHSNKDIDFFSALVTDDCLWIPPPTGWRKSSIGEDPTSTLLLVVLPVEMDRESTAYYLLPYCQRRANNRFPQNPQIWLALEIFQSTRDEELWLKPRNINRTEHWWRAPGRILYYGREVCAVSSE
jgi:hypothetical protein